jgi:hypothetical protein
MSRWNAKRGVQGNQVKSRPPRPPNTLYYNPQYFVMNNQPPTVPRVLQIDEIRSIQYQTSRKSAGITCTQEQSVGHRPTNPDCEPGATDGRDAAAAAKKSRRWALQEAIARAT